ncbi:MAG: hypothetical protein ABIS47_01450 [Acidimicrobiales bacterium]
MGERGLIVVMGSGETAPSMVTVHQRALARVPQDEPAVILDTPYGFQGNADDLTERTLGHFRERVGRELVVCSFRSAAAAAADPLEHERSLALLREAGWAYAGPGSPSYTLRTWGGTPVPDLLARVADRGGVLTFSSAAALTIGVATVPVYEIYKVGEEPRWLDGLDLLGRLAGLRAALIPHWDNAEGGTHDTRFSYLGEARLHRLEAELPEGACVIGVDEHTALLLDLEAGTASVTGRGGVVVRFGGAEVLSLPGGASIPLDELRGAAEGRAAGTGGGGDGGASRGDSDRGGGGGGSEAGGRPARETPSAILEAVGSASVGADAEAAEAAFDAALTARDADGALAAVLALEAALDAWAADPTQSDERSRARATLRGMATRLGRTAAVGMVDRRDIVAPFVEALLDLRLAARADKRWADADAIRDVLVAAAIEIRDRPGATDWSAL